MEMYVAAYEEAEEEAWRADPSRPSPREAWRRADHGRCVLEGGGSTVPAPAGPGKQLCFIHNFAPQVPCPLGVVLAYTYANRLQDETWREKRCVLRYFPETDGEEGDVEMEEIFAR